MNAAVSFFTDLELVTGEKPWAVFQRMEDLKAAFEENVSVREAYKTPINPVFILGCGFPGSSSQVSPLAK